MFVAVLLELVVVTTCFAFNIPTRIMDTKLHSSMDRGMNNNMPNADELMAQKAEAYNALSSFHETSSTAMQSEQIGSLLQGLDTIGLDGSSDEEMKAEYWECAKGAITYSVPIDPAAGIKVGRISKPYRCSVKIDMGELSMNKRSAQQKGLRLVESIQFVDNVKEQQSLSAALPFVRSIPLGADVDVDSVDGSYSLDSVISPDDAAPLPLLPPSLLKGIDPNAVQFLVEHTLAVSDVQRCRCMLLYGSIDDANDSDETTMDDDDYAILAARTAAENAKRKRDTVKVDDRSYRLIGLILAEETKVMPTTSTTTTSTTSTRKSLSKSEQGSEREEASPLDFLEINQNGEEEDKMDRLVKSIENHNKNVIEQGLGEQTTAEMQLHNVGMFGLTSGVWLGDSFIREAIAPSKVKQSSSLGFGKKPSGGEEDRFATWSLGVQKCSLQFQWDYSKFFSQDYNWGKCMGTATSLSSMANIKSEGMVVMNEARKMKKREEQRVIVDYDGYVAGLFGSSFFRAPRFMSFSQQSSSINREPYLTEYMVFFRPKSDNSSSSTATSTSGAVEDEAIPEYYCSRTSRLYDSKDGSLMQGSTAFFALQQPQMEETEE
jgi:hypothetical protein